MDIIIKFLSKHFTSTRINILIALIMMALGFSNNQIKDKLGLAYTSLRKYRKAFDNADIEPLFSNGGDRRKGELHEYYDDIVKEFEKKQPATLREANERIFKITGKKLSLNRLGKFLKKRGLKIEQLDL